MTRVLCAFTDLHPKTVTALRTLAMPRCPVDVVCVAHNEFGYRDAIADRWTGDEDLVLIEHDIEISDDVLPSFEGCDGPWCTFAYQHMTLDNWLDRGLGCVRFSAALQRAIPFGKCLASPAPVPGSWRHLDGQIAATLETAGHDRHVHESTVTHWNRQLRR